MTIFHTVRGPTAAVPGTLSLEDEREFAVLVTEIGDANNEAAPWCVAEKRLADVGGIRPKGCWMFARPNPRRERF